MDVSDPRGARSTTVAVKVEKCKHIVRPILVSYRRSSGIARWWHPCAQMETIKRDSESHNGLRVIKVLGSKGPWCEARGMSVEGVDCVRLTLFKRAIYFIFYAEQVPLPGIL